MPDLDSAPATKADVAAAKSELKGQMNRMALEIVQTNVRIDRLDEGLRGEMRLIRSDAARIMDTAVSRMETLWKESALLPQVIDDHERRLRALEGRPPL